MPPPPRRKALISPCLIFHHPAGGGGHTHNTHLPSRATGHGRRGCGPRGHPGSASPSPCPAVTLPPPPPPMPGHPPAIGCKLSPHVRLRQSGGSVQAAHRQGRTPGTARHRQQNPAQDPACTPASVSPLKGGEKSTPPPQRGSPQNSSPSKPPKPAPPEAAVPDPTGAQQPRQPRVEVKDFSFHQ